MVGLKGMKNSSGTIGNRTRDLPTCASTNFSIAYPFLCKGGLIISVCAVVGWEKCWFYKPNFFNFHCMNKVRETAVLTVMRTLIIVHFYGTKSSQIPEEKSSWISVQ
jgi:hypothetical protein